MSDKQDSIDTASQGNEESTLRVPVPKEEEEDKDSLSGSNSDHAPCQPTEDNNYEPCQDKESCGNDISAIEQEEESEPLMVTAEPEDGSVASDDMSYDHTEIEDSKSELLAGDSTPDIQNSSAWDVVSMLSFPPNWDVIRSMLEDDSLPKDSKTHFVLNLRYHTKLNQALLHLAFTHEEKAPSRVIEMIIETCGTEALDAVDDEGNTPLHYACEAKAPLYIIELCLNTAGKHALLKVNNKGESPLDMMYSSNEDALDYINFLQLQCNDEMGSMVPRLPFKTIASTLEWTQNQGVDRQRDLLKSNFLQTLINTISSGPAYVGVIMADLYLQILVVWSLSSQNQLFLRGLEPMQNAAFILLSLLCFWDGIRLVFQIISTPFRAFITSIYSWLRLVQFVLVASLLSNGTILQSTQYLDYIIVTGIAWLLLVFVIADLNYEVAVFLSAVLKSIAALLPFVLVLSITLVSFAHMYYMSNVTTGQCIGVSPGADWSCDLTKTTEATFGMIFETVNYNFSNMSDNSMKQNIPLSIAFAIIVWILLLNILLAQIINTFSKVREDGISEFWARRFIYITEHPLIAFSSTFTSPTIVYYKKGVDADANLGSETAELTEVDPENGRNISISPNKITLPPRFDFNLLNKKTSDTFVLDGDELNFSNWWTGLTSELSGKDRVSFLFKRASGSEMIFPGKITERAVFGLPRNGNVGLSSVLARLFTYLLIYPLSLVVQLILFGLGCGTFGLLWPTYMREFLVYGPTNELKKEIAELKEHTCRDDSITEVKALLMDVIERKKEEN